MELQNTQRDLSAHPQNELYLFPDEQGNWMAEHVGPHAQDVYRNFGANILPTAFRLPMSGLEVIARLQPLNPGVFMDYFATKAEWVKEVGL